MPLELRSSIRGMLRRPFYPLVAIVVLALGLAASISAFTYINGFFQPLPGADADRLVRMFGMTPEEPSQEIPYLDFLDYRAEADAFEGLAATQPYFAASVRHEKMTEVAFLEAVSGDYFSVLGIRTVVGRGITAEDDKAGADAVAVLSHAWWQQSFNSDPGVVGRTVHLNFRPFTVVGVMAPEFAGVAADFRPDVWIPIAPFKDRYVGWARRSDDRDVPLVRVFGRLGPGTSPEAASTELSAIAQGLEEAYPRTTTPRRVRLDEATWIDPKTRAQEWSTVRVMMIAAAGLLLLVCANVGNLLLSIASGRQQELTMRAALGASPGNLVGQVLMESLLLSTIAGGIALVVAVPASARLGSYFARPSVWGENVAREAGIDLRVVGFALTISVLVGALAGLLPAIRASRRDLVATLKAGGKSTEAAKRIGGWRLPGARDLLVTAQVGLAVALLVVAGLVLRTFGSVRDLDPGFDYDSLVVTHLSTSSTTLQPEEREGFFREISERLTDEAWVRSATVADYPLLSPHPTMEFKLEGQDEASNLVYSRVIPGFFESLEIEATDGRTFAAGDVGGAPDVAIVNESLARRFFADGSVVGRRVWWPQSEGEADREFQIVGVVKDTKTRDFFADPEPTLYFSYPQFMYPTGSALVVSTHSDPRSTVLQLNRWLREFEPHLAIVNVVTYSDVVRGYQYTQRMNAELFSVLAFFGLGLAAVGIFSVMSLAVAARTREIGIRMSIGALPRDIGGLVLRRALVPVSLGLAAGIGVSFAATGLVESLLFGVEPNDPTALAVGALVLLLAALVATYLPARRAVRVDPVIALRHD